MPYRYKFFLDPQHKAMPLHAKRFGDEIFRDSKVQKMYFKATANYFETR